MSTIRKATTLAGQVLSLPMHPHLEVEIQDRVTQALRNAILAR